jgi:hypothetical protein
MQSQTLVTKTKVRGALAPDFVRVEKAPAIQAIVETDGNEGRTRFLAILNDKGHVEALIATAPHIEATAMNPDSNWE